MRNGWLEAFAVATDRRTSLEKGAGAAGGIGYALLLLGATREPGIDLVATAVSLAERARAADLVVTGEGAFDFSSRAGKVPYGVAAIASDSEERAEALARANDLSMVRLMQNRPGPVPTPEEAAAHQWTDQELQLAAQRRRFMSVGTPDQVRDDLERRRTYADADELIITTQIHDEAERELEEGLALAPEDHRLLDGMARVALTRGRWHDAIDFGERAVALVVVGVDRHAVGGGENAVGHGVVRQRPARRC